MKNTFLFLFLFAIISCNDSKTESKTPGADSSATTGNSIEKIAATGNCSNLYLFHKGTVVEAVNYDGGGKETSKQVSTVVNVSNEGGATVSEVEMKNISAGSNEQVFTGKYSCDGNNLYVDLSSLFASMEAKGAKIEGDPIVFPINITEGQSLPDASYSFTVSKGDKEMKIKSTIKNRKVEGRESVTTPAGTFNCYKISATVDASMEMPGQDEKTKQMMEAMKKAMPKQRFTMFFDPNVSIVKVDTYSGDQLVSRSEVTAIRK